MSTKRSPQLFEYRQAVIGLQNVAFMEPMVKLRLRDEIEKFIETGKYIKHLEDERHALLNRISALEEHNTRLHRYVRMIEDRWNKDLSAFDTYIKEAEAAITATGCDECFGAGFVFTQKTPCPKCTHP